MILDHIHNRERYYPLDRQIERGLRYLAVTDFSEVEPGKYDIGGDGVFAIVDTYKPAVIESKKLEAHHKYVDIQFIAHGEESVGYATLTDQNLIDNRFEESDLGFYDGDEMYAKLSPNMFCIFFPEDLHKPGVGDYNESVKKVVVKVPVKK
jgi:YhcH/YjgK/YiaL family protein